MSNYENDGFIFKYFDFRKRLHEFECKDIIEPSGDTVSAYDMAYALRKKLGYYNEALMDNLEVQVIRFNKRNGYSVFTPDEVTKKCRRIDNIGFYVEENGSYYIKLYYVDGRGRDIGTGIVDNFVKLDACDEEAIKNKRYLMKCLNILADYSAKHPGESFRWDLKNRIVDLIQINGDFLSCTLDIYHIDRPEPYFTSSKDAGLAIYEYGYGEKNISQDSCYYLKRMSVNLNDVDPLVSDIVRKEYNLEGKKLVK